MYRIVLDEKSIPCGIRQVMDGSIIPFDPANTDYQNFKAQINADEAQLEDADGNVMTAQEAKDYVKELP